MNVTVMGPRRHVARDEQVPAAVASVERAVALIEAGDLEGANSEILHAVHDGVDAVTYLQAAIDYAGQRAPRGVVPTPG